jgi:monofunctional biosynthetic peptidoglycan transglycosylase
MDARPRVVKVKFFIRLFFLVLSLFFGVGLLVALWLWVIVPNSDKIKSCLTTTMFEVELCPTGKNYVKLNNITKHLRKAVVTTEDGHFYVHNGFDWDALQYSFEQNLEKGRYARGGSTISQQLTKNMFLTRDKTIWRKVKEAIITYQIEKTLNKNEILERYLNVVQFGKNLFGVKKAAQFYFKKSPGQLSLVESAFLAFLLPSPEKYSKSYFRKELTGFARKRMNFIIKGMYKIGHVNEVEYNEAMAQLAYFPNTPPPVEFEELKLVDGDNSTSNGQESSSEKSDTEASQEAPLTIEDLENLKVEEN